MQCDAASQQNPNSQLGATENARNEISAPSKMQVVKIRDIKIQVRKKRDMKIRDMKMREMKIREKCDFGLSEH